jgi:predicted HTH transcriptional regulator
MDAFSDRELLIRLSNFEDQFVERKTSRNVKGWLQTIVAFANSSPIAYPGILFIGVTDKGLPEAPTNLETLQKTVSEVASAAYPPIYILPRIVDVNGIQVLAVIVPGSENRPHFAAKAFVREGTQTKEASEDQFNRLIAQRNSASYEIQKWLGKEVSFYMIERFGDETHHGTDVVVADCNQFYVTLRRDNQLPQSYSLRRVELTFDHNRKRLGVAVDYR